MGRERNAPYVRRGASLRAAALSGVSCVLRERYLDKLARLRAWIVSGVNMPRRKGPQNVCLAELPRITPWLKQQDATRALLVPKLMPPPRQQVSSQQQPHVLLMRDDDVI